MEDVKAFIADLPLFQEFRKEDIEQLVSRSHLQIFAPQETIINFGQPGRFLGVILDGEAEAVVATRTGDRHRLGLIVRGDVLGEMSLLTGEPTNADVIAVQECRILLVPQDVFTSLITTNPHAVKVLAKTLSDRLRSRSLDEEEQGRVDQAWHDAADPYGLELKPGESQKILVLNCGSSSLKFDFFDTDDESRNLEGIVERIGQEDARLVAHSRQGKFEESLGKIGYEDAFQAVVGFLTDSAKGGLDNLEEISAVGHRVVHGGYKYSQPVIIDQEVIEDIESFSRLAPLHNPPNLVTIKAACRFLPPVPQIAVFDTAFHQRIPPHAHVYGLPQDFYRDDQIRRYGFHGISHNFVALEAASFLKRKFRELKLITCHLGNGASVCAIDHGRSIDTSMGLTPLEGLIMGTRSGDLDPSIIFHLAREKGMSLDEIDDILNRRSGLKGLSGISSDLREIEDAAHQGDPQALLAIHVFCYRVRKYIGAYLAALGGLDALIFTGGIGEGSAWVRGLSCQGLSGLGILVDSLLNKALTAKPEGVEEISDESSQVRILVIPTDEGKMIARESLRTLQNLNISRIIKQHEDKKIPIEVSAHHVHLSREDVDALFGSGTGLSHRSDLSQPGQFACEESVNLIGPKGRVERVRVLGPERKHTQIEISMTEEYKLGVKAPIRASGDLAGSPGIALEGPKGTSRVSQGVICSLRHIHMSPEDALTFGLKDRDIVSVKVEGERALTFGDILVRVHPDFHLSMHIDTDEANAANIRTGMKGTLVNLQERR